MRVYIIGVLLVIIFIVGVWRFMGWKIFKDIIQSPLRRYPEFGECVVGDDDWRRDCIKWRGKVLTGKYSHWCWDWDFVPVDETCDEWPCACSSTLKKELDKQ